MKKHIHIMQSPSCIIKICMWLFTHYSNQVSILPYTMFLLGKSGNKFFPFFQGNLDQWRQSTPLCLNTNPLFFHGHLHLMMWLKMVGGMPLLLYAFMANTGINLHVSHIIRSSFEILLLVLPRFDASSTNTAIVENV